MTLYPSNIHLLKRERLINHVARAIMLGAGVNFAIQVRFQNQLPIIDGQVMAAPLGPRNTGGLDIVIPLRESYEAPLDPMTRVAPLPSGLRVYIGSLN